MDGAKFLEQYKSFSVQTKAKQAQQLSNSYKIDGVPAMGVQGRYVTSGSQAGSNERALAVTDALVQTRAQAGLTSPCPRVGGPESAGTCG